jgi:hypothetical protein
MRDHMLGHLVCSADVKEVISVGAIDAYNDQVAFSAVPDLLLMEESN